MSHGRHKSSKRSSRHRARKPRWNASGLSAHCRRLAVEPLEDRRLLNGLTLITHGFSEDASPMGWVTAMANQVVSEISSRFQCNESDVAEIKLTVNSNLTVTPTWVNETNETSATSKCSETVVLLDWKSVAGIGGSSTVNVAAAVAPSCISPFGLSA